MSARDSLKVHETTRDDGTFAPTWLVCRDTTLEVVSDEGTFALPDGAIEAIMARFGAPFDPAEPLVTIAVLDVSGGRLRHVRHKANVDVIARDWLVWEASGEEPRVALATTVAGALTHLAKVHARAGQ